MYLRPAKTEDQSGISNTLAPWLSTKCPEMTDYTLQILLFFFVVKNNFAPLGFVITKSFRQRIKQYKMFTRLHKCPIVVHPKTDKLRERIPIYTEKREPLQEKRCLLFIQVVCNQGLVVQSVVSLTSSLVVKILTVLVSTISNSQVFLLKKI